ncbi:flagellar hook-associated protein 3 FlgL [Sagittula marina]|uniref:Flagellin n=1 Tax=Sagittula marina TaxID=943940 RepID=A0A7W6DUD6_9RHOB|nr:flagellin [Sagittula marina]MBB3987087.1 flagellar hook-associated protein 3 FlgL [Sagittula marina]
MIGFTRAPSTLYSNLLRRNANAEMQAQLSRAEQELATGIKSDIYKSLGPTAAEALSLDAALSRDTAQIAANKLLGGRLDTMSSALGSMGEAVQSTLQLAVTNSGFNGGTASGLQTSARASLDALMSMANANYGGTPLFAGPSDGARALQDYDTPRAETGLSPRVVIDGVMAGGLGSVSDATARIAELDAIFSNTAANPDETFDALFFTGATSADPMSAGIGDGITVNYGVQANDDAFRQALQGLVMLATTDASEIGDAEAYAIWVDTAAARLSSGLEGLLDSQVQLDTASARIDEANTGMEDRANLYKGRVAELVEVDSYEAATEITALETQLQASYAVTARLSQLSFLNFMR